MNGHPQNYFAGERVSSGHQDEILVKEDYILIKPHNLNYLEIITLSAELISMAEYRSKPTIWLLSGEVKGFNHTHLFELKEFAEEHIPEGIEGHKTAFVAEMAFHRAIAEGYIRIAEDLPIRYKVFASLEEAEAWVRS